MKLFTLMYFSAVTFISLNAQETDPSGKLKSEISISLYNLKFDNLSVKYSRNISEATWLKIGLINLHSSIRKFEPALSLSYPTTDSQFSAGLFLGIDKHKLMSKKFEFVYGFNLQMTYGYSNHHTDNPNISESLRDDKYIRYSPGIGCGFGVFYSLHENISLGLELAPSAIYYSEDARNNPSSNSYKTKGFDFSLSSENAMISVKFKL